MYLKERNRSPDYGHDLSYLPSRYRRKSTTNYATSFWKDLLNTTPLLNISGLSPIRRGFKPGFVNYKKGRTRLAVACDKVYQLLAHAYDMVGGSLRILRLPAPPLKLVATI
jgi:hypothetical protein